MLKRQSNIQKNCKFGTQLIFLVCGQLTFQYRIWSTISLV
jgi:hypothetical protein